MKVSLVMTVIGEDRPGLVESVARLVATHEGNWLESRMARLGGHFAGVLRVEIPSAKQVALTQDLAALKSRGLTIVVHADHSQEAAPRQRLMFMDLIGHDRPGIVRQISAALAAHSVNVEELQTECVSAPMSGEILFKAHARLQVPDGCDQDKLRAELEKIAADLIVDVTLGQVPTSQG